MNEEEIKDMSLEGTAEEKEEKQKDAEKAVADMSLDEPPFPSVVEIVARLAKVLPGVDLIDIGNLRIMKMVNGSYKKTDGTTLAAEDLIKIDKFLKSKEIE